MSWIGSMGSWMRSIGSWIGSIGSWVGRIGSMGSWIGIGEWRVRGGGGINSGKLDSWRGWINGGRFDSRSWFDSAIYVSFFSCTVFAVDFSLVAPPFFQCLHNSFFVAVLAAALFLL